MTRLALIEAHLKIMAAHKKRAERERLECRHINRLERQRQININTPEADLIREVYPVAEKAE